MKSFEIAKILESDPDKGFSELVQDQVESSKIYRFAVTYTKEAGTGTEPTDVGFGFLPEERDALMRLNNAKLVFEKGNPDFPQSIDASKRPFIISALCYPMLFVGLPVSLILLFSEAALNIGDWYPPFLAVCIGGGLICTIGLLNMRKWAVVLYTIGYVLVQVVFTVTGNLNYSSFFFPLVFIGVGVVNWPRLI